MSTERQMGKEDVVHIKSGMLLSLLKKWNWVNSSDMDETRGCHKEWSKSEIEKQIQYINAYKWNLGNWYWWDYFQGRNRDADKENGLVNTELEWEGGKNWERSVDRYTLPCVK